MGGATPTWRVPAVRGRSPEGLGPLNWAAQPTQRERRSRTDRRTAPQNCPPGYNRPSPALSPPPRVPMAGMVALCCPTPLQIQPRGLAASHCLKITPAFRGAAGDLAGGFGRGEEFTAPPCPPHRLCPIWPCSASAPACHPAGWGRWPAAWGQGCHGVWGTRVCLARQTLPVEVGKLRHRGGGTALPQTLRGSPKGRRGPSTVSSARQAQPGTSLAPTGPCLPGHRCHH